MKQIIYIIIAVLMTISSTGQEFNNEINNKVKELGLDSSKIKASEYPNQLNAVWTKLGHEENKYNPYIVLPIKIWEQLFEKQHINTANTNSHVVLAVNYSTILIDLSKYDKAIQILNSAYPLRKNLPKSVYKTLLNNLETCYKSSNEISKAIQIRNELIENKLINNYWRIYKACGLVDAAIEDFLLFEEKKYYPGKNKIIHPAYYNNLSRLYFSIKKVDSAIKYANIGLQNVDLALQDESIRFTNKNEILNNWKALYIGFLGKCDLNTKSYTAAIPKLEYAINNGKIDIESNTLSMIYLSLCYLNLNNIEKYKLYSNKVKDLLSSIDGEDVTRSYYSASHQFYLKLNKTDSALKYMTLYTQYKDKVSAGVKKNQSILLLGQLEIQKRRNELNSTNISLNNSEKEKIDVKNKLWILIGVFVTLIIVTLFLIHFLLQNIKNKKLLNSKNNELTNNIQLVNEQILKNDFLFKELHHRVKNNLQLIYSLLNLQKRRLNESETKLNLTAVQNRIHTMSLVHEFLYSTDNFEHVNVLAYTTTLTSHLKSIYKKDDYVGISYQIDDELELETERMIYLGLIINEIISNTFKYEIGNDTLILINIQLNNGIVEVSIKDNGPGFDQNEIREESLGLKLIKIMCVQLNANHELTSTNGVEHKFNFIFEK